LSLERVRSKLGKRESKKSKRSTASASAVADSDEGEYYLGKDEEIEKKRKLDSIKKQVKDLRREMKQSAKDTPIEHTGDDTGSSKLKLAEENSMVKDFFDTRKAYQEKAVRSKGTEREAATLALLARFQNKVRSATETFGELEPLPHGGPQAKDTEEPDEDLNDTSW